MELGIQTGFGQEAAASLQTAILLYGTRSGTVPAHYSFATVHKVTGGKRPTVLPGVNLTAEALADALSALSEGTGSRRWQATSECVVASGDKLLAWWSPAQVRHMHFSDNELASGPASQPPLFWVAHRADLYVFALAESKRPTLTTKLFQPVHFNMYSDGRVCIGTSVRPKELDAAQYEEMFFKSRFTGPHGHGWQLAERASVTGLWRRLLTEAGTAPFPTEVLAPAGFNIAQALDRISAGKAKR